MVDDGVEADLRPVDRPLDVDGGLQSADLGSAGQGAADDEIDFDGGDVGRSEEDLEVLRPAAPFVTVTEELAGDVPQVVAEVKGGCLDDEFPGFLGAAVRIGTLQVDVLTEPGGPPVTDEQCLATLDEPAVGFLGENASGQTVEVEDPH